MARSSSETVSHQPSFVSKRLTTEKVAVFADARRWIWRDLCRRPDHALVQKSGRRHGPGAGRPSPGDCPASSIPPDSEKDGSSNRPSRRKIQAMPLFPCESCLCVRLAIACIFRLLGRLLEPSFSESGGIFVGDLIMHLFRKAGTFVREQETYH
jgi:hypothetical protein